MNFWIFLAFAALTVFSSFLVVFSRNIVHAGFSLLFTLFGVAGLYAILGADFLAVTQVVVYIGGILVLVLFTVMMTRIPVGKIRRWGLDLYVLPGIFCLALFALLYRVITGTVWPLRALEEATATTAEIGTNFMTDYIFPFEYASLLLLVAMVGAALLIRESKVPTGQDEAGRPKAETGRIDPERGGGETVTVGLNHFLMVGAVLFCLGLLAVMTRRNAVGVLMGVELILNAANLNFVAFARFVENGVDGHVIAAFVIVLAAAEAAVALAIVLAMFRNFGTVHVDTVNRLKR